MSGRLLGGSWASPGSKAPPGRLLASFRAVLEASWAAIVAHMAPQSLPKCDQNSIKTDAKIRPIFGIP